MGWSRPITIEQKIACWLHKNFRRSDDGWEYELEKVVIGTETKVIRGVTKSTPIWSTYDDDDDNSHNWDAYSHSFHLQKAREVIKLMHQLEGQGSTRPS